MEDVSFRKFPGCMPRRYIYWVDLHGTCRFCRKICDYPMHLISVDISACTHCWCAIYIVNCEVYENPSSYKTNNQVVKSCTSCRIKIQYVKLHQLRSSSAFCSPFCSLILVIWCRYLSAHQDNAQLTISHPFVLVAGFILDFKNSEIDLLGYSCNIHS